MAKVAHQPDGVTLLELMCCLMVIAIGCCMAAPGVIQALASYHMKVVKQDLQAAVQYARVLSYGRGETYALSPLSGEKEWSKGIQLFKVNRLKHQTNDTMNLVRVWQWPASHLVVRWQGVRGEQQVIFSPQPTHAMSNGHFLITVGKLKAMLVLNRLGRLIEEKNT